MKGFLYFMLYLSLASLTYAGLVLRALCESRRIRDQINTSTAFCWLQSFFVLLRLRQSRIHVILSVSSLLIFVTSISLLFILNT